MKTEKPKITDKDNFPSKEAEIAAERLAHIFISQINFDRIKNKNKYEKQ